MPLTDRHVRALLVASHETQADEIDCDEFLACMPAYAEACASGDSVPVGFAAAVAHERLCANCAEECDALVKWVLGGSLTEG